MKSSDGLNKAKLRMERTRKAFEKASADYWKLCNAANEWQPGEKEEAADRLLALLYLTKERSK